MPATPFRFCYPKLTDRPIPEGANASEIRRPLVAGENATFHYLGDCRFKMAPQRAYRL